MFQNSEILLREISISYTGIVVYKQFYYSIGRRSKAVMFQNSEILLREISISNTGIVVDKQFYYNIGIRV